MLGIKMSVSTALAMMAKTAAMSVKVTFEFLIEVIKREADSDCS